MSTPATCPDRACHRRRRQAGLSLLEVLIASLLIVTVVVFLAPLFVSAIANNVRGREASQAIALSTSGVESIGSASRDNYRLDLNGAAVDLDPDDDVLKVVSSFLDPGPLDTNGRELFIGDETWVSFADIDPDAVVLPEELKRARWTLEIEMRDYSYFDVGRGLPSASDPDTLLLGGNPYLFDNEGQFGRSARHLTETRTLVRTRREGSFLGAGQVLTTSRFRSF